MKTYFRLLGFAKPIEKYAIPYAFSSILMVIFNTLNLALLIPMLNILFSEKQEPFPVTPHFRISANYFYELFAYYFSFFEHQHGKSGALGFVCITIVISVFLSNFFRYFSQRIIEDLRARILLSLRESVFKNVMDLHLGYFTNERKGDVLSKISSDVTVVQFTVANTLQVIFKDPLQLVAYLFMLFNISTRLTLIAMLVVPVSGLIISTISKRLRHQAAEVQNSYGTLVSIIEEALSGIKVIKSFNAAGFIKKKFADENNTLTRITRSMSKRQQLASPISEFLGVSTVAGIVFYGGSLILQHKTSMRPEAFITYIIIFSQVINPIKTLSSAFSYIHQGIAAGNRVLELVDQKSEVTDSQSAIVQREFKESIEFRNVSFSYGDTPILKNINFKILKGETMALVGPSGGGKSTISDLLSRFYDIQEGSILIDGHDIRDLNTESLRELMGIVNQESILFNDTIYNNIVFGRKDVSMKDVENAARIANAHDFIMGSEFGYQTNIGDRGVKLSGGQKQRLSIARAILINPPILILDEATSALDTESEKLVQDALNNLMKNRTSLVIAHRLSTVQNADKIVVLDGGRIAESGDHQSLILKEGIYKKLSSMQALNPTEQM